MYGNLRETHLDRKVQLDEKFNRYVPEVFPTARPMERKSAKEKAEERRLRIVAKACGKWQVSEVEANVEDNHSNTDDDVSPWGTSRRIEGKSSVLQLRARQPNKTKGPRRRGCSEPG